MSIIVLSGPEKAGKTTLAAALSKALTPLGCVSIRKWGPVKPDDRVYTPALKEDVGKIGSVIWDRGWPCEHVYSRLLGRERRLAHDPWLGEWLHGRAIQSTGIGVIVTAASAILHARRDETDLPVDPVLEKYFFEHYANRFKWLLVNPTEDGIDGTVKRILAHLDIRLSSLHMFTPPAYAGPLNAPILVVGESINARSRFPGAWLPFSSPYTIRFAKLFGATALLWGWTNADSLTREMASGRSAIICCGNKAFQKAGQSLGRFSATQLIPVPHPSYGFRWDDPLEYEDKVRKAISILGA